VVGVAEQPREQ